MTLVSTVAPLAAYAVGFQTIVYIALPARLRTTWAPMVTGTIGAVLTLLAGLIFGFDTIGLGAVDTQMVVTWAVATFTLTSIVGWLMLIRPKLRPQLADPRLAALGRWQAVRQIALRIPIMTALIEEAFFRGVLHAALMALYPPSVALWGGAALFGLWHIGPGLDQAQRTRRTTFAGGAHVVLTVIATTVAGAGLVWLRMETGSIWVPVAVHAGINMTMAVFARFAARTEVSGDNLQPVDL